MVEGIEGAEPKKSRRPKWWVTFGRGAVAGLVLLLALLWLSAGTAVSLFPKSTQRVYAVFKSVGGLKPGEKVQVAGVPKGKVDKIDITEVVVVAEGHLKLDEETLRELLNHAHLEEAGAPVEIEGMDLSPQPRDVEKKKDWVWNVKLTVQKGDQPAPVPTRGTIRLNSDIDVPPALRQRLVASFADIELKQAVNIAMRDGSDDFDTVFNAFSRDPKKDAKLDEEKEGVRSTAFSVKVRMPQSMVLCTLELDEDVSVGWEEDEEAKRPPYLITVAQMTPLIGTPFISMERTPKGKPLKLPRSPEEKRVVRRRPLNLGKQEATDIAQLAENMKSLAPKIEEAFGNLRGALKGMDEFMDKVNRGEGAMSVLVSDAKFRDDLKAAVADLRSLVHKADAGEGTIGKAFGDPQLYDELLSASKNLDSVLAKIDRGQGTANRLLDDPKLYDEAVALSTEAKDVASKLNRGEGALPRLINDPKLGENVEKAFEGVKETMDKIRTEGLFGDIVNKEDMRLLVSDTREMMADAKVVMHGVAKGESTLGKLAVDPKLGKKVEEAIGGAAETFGGIARTRTFLGFTSKYHAASERFVNSAYLRVAPRENMFVQLGGAAISTSDGSPIDSDPDDDGEAIFKPEVQIGYRFFDNHLTLRGGLLEGEVGGGVDYEFNMPGLDHDFMLTAEARAGHDEDDDGIDEREDVIVTGELSTKIWKYIRVYMGAGNSTDGVDFMGGVTFEWNDDDLKSFLGLVGSAASR